jgi:hypothetical protein
MVSIVSGVKVLQAGWDISKSGLACFTEHAADHSPGQSLFERAIQARGFTGRAASREETELADLETATSIRSRLARLGRNVKLTAELIAGGLRGGEGIAVTSAWLPAHPRHALALQTYGTGGCFVYVRFSTDRIAPDILERLERRVVEQASLARLPLAAVSSFGMATPHVTLVSASGSATLRICPGSGDLHTVERVAALCLEVLQEVHGGCP